MNRRPRIHSTIASDDPSCRLARYRIELLDCRRPPGDLADPYVRAQESLRSIIALMSEFTVDLEQETNGRWIAEIPQLSGVLAYGTTREEAVNRAEALAFRVLADRLEQGEAIPQVAGVFTIAE